MDNFYVSYQVTSDTECYVAVLTYVVLDFVMDGLYMCSQDTALAG